MKSKSKNKTFEEHLKIAKDIVNNLESGDCSLDEMLNLYQEGIESLKACSKKLSIFEEKIKVIKKQDDEIEFDDLIWRLEYL